MNNKKISQSLLELSDAIEQLAIIIGQQKHFDNNQLEEKLKIVGKKVGKTFRQPDKITQSEKILSKYDKDYLERWLVQKNIIPGKRINNLRVDDKLYKVSDYLADHYFQLQFFYEQLKRSQSIKRDFKLKSTKKNISYIRKWCNMLHKNKIIDSFYFLDDLSIDVDLSLIHKATYFINGNWLEIFLRRELALLFRKHIDEIETFDIMAQLEIVKPNQKGSEVDLLIMLNKKVYWFECKSGEIGSFYYKRFKEHRKLLGLSSKHAFLVVPQMRYNQVEAVMRNCGMTTLYANSLSSYLEKLFFSKK